MAALAVVHGDGEGVAAVEVGVRRVDDGAAGTVAVDGDAAVRRFGGGGPGQVVVVGVGRGQGQVEGPRVAVLAHGDAGGGALGDDRCVVDGRDGDGDLGGGGEALTVLDGVGEGVAAAEVGGGCVDDAAVDQGRAAVVRRLHTGDGEALVVDVGVVGQRIDRDRRVLVGAGRVGARLRGIIDRHDGNLHGRGGCQPVAVGDCVRDAVGAAVVGHGRVDNDAAVAVGLDLGRAVFRRADFDQGESIVVHVLVVAEHVNGAFRILVGGNAVVIGHGRIVDRRHGDAETRRGSHAAAVGDYVFQRIAAAEVAVRRIADGLVGDDGATVGRTADGLQRQRVPVGVAVVLQDGDHGRLIFGESGRVAHTDRGVGHRLDVDSHTHGRAGAACVGDGDGEGIGAVEIGGRHIGELRPIRPVLDGGAPVGCRLHHIPGQVAVVHVRGAQRIGEGRGIAVFAHGHGGLGLGRHRRVIDGRHHDIERRRGRHTGRIGDDVVQAVDAVVVGARCVVDRGIDHRRVAVLRRCRDADDG